MNKGLKILIDRMREYPDDFEGSLSDYTLARGGSWLNCLREAQKLCERKLLSNEDAQALDKAVKEHAVAVFEARVLEALNSPRGLQQEQVEQDLRMYQGAINQAVLTRDSRGILAGASPNNFVYSNDLSK
jgi:hypothetical protein